MAARYQHLSPAFLADAVAKLEVVFAKVSYQSATGLEDNTPTVTIPITLPRLEA
jgi:hypothetical protein